MAVLSRFPFLACRQHTNEGFLLNGRHFRVSRGFAEVDVRVNAEYKFTLIAAHLKSRREVPQADEADLREQEAAILREIIDARLRSDPDLNLIVLGDFNDLKDSKPIRSIIGRGKDAMAGRIRLSEVQCDRRALPLPEALVRRAPVPRLQGQCLAHRGLSGGAVPGASWCGPSCGVS